MLDLARYKISKAIGAYFEKASKRVGTNIEKIYWRRLGIFQWKSDEISGERKFIKEVLPSLFPVASEPIIFDVGMNEGKYTKDVLDSLPNAQIYGFEPNPQTFKRTSLRFTGCEQVTVENIALSSRDGETELFDYASGNGTSHASLYRSVLTEQHRSSDVATFNVSLCTLDDYVEKHGIEEISFLKIDTEGHELDVLRGATRIISSGRVKAVQFEFNEMNVISRCFIRDFYEELKEYRFYRLRSDGLLPLGDYDTRHEIFKFQNIIAIQKDYCARIEAFEIENPWV